MTNRKEYVSAIVVSTGNFNKPGIVIALYGPRGGTVCVAELSPMEAAMLRDQLDKAVKKYQLS